MLHTQSLEATHIIRSPLRSPDRCPKPSYFSRTRRGELGHQSPITGADFARYAQQAAWRADCRHVANGDRLDGVVGLA